MWKLLTPDFDRQLRLLVFVISSLTYFVQNFLLFKLDWSFNGFRRKSFADL